MAETIKPVWTSEDNPRAVERHREAVRRNDLENEIRRLLVGSGTAWSGAALDALDDRYVAYMAGIRLAVLS